MARIIGIPRTQTITLSLEPAHNVIGSLSLLDMAQDFTGLGEWVYETVGSQPPERLRTNRIVLLDAGAHLGGASWPSFVEWLDDLAARDAAAMRDGALQARLTAVRKVVGGETPTPSEILTDRAAYLSLVEEFSRHKGEAYDRSIWEEEHGLLNSPPAMQRVTVTHLRTMWDEVVAPEWEQNLAALEASKAAFESLGFEGLTAAEALGRVALRAQIPQESMGWLASLEHVILIPSAHTGPYILQVEGKGDTTARFLFGARIPEGAPARLPTLSRSELLMLLSALADDTRLRILELLAQKGERGTPEITTQLEISQSAASRHLEHLTATGYLIARRHQGTKLYQLRPDRIDHTFKVLKEFVSRPG